jgi:quercetin dioxygenase-like cupin family protein
MEVRTRGSYEIAGRELVAEGTDLWVQVLTLAAGQCVPWHYHSEITDAFVCLEGPMVVETRAPPNEYLLTTGQRCAVPPRTRPLRARPGGWTLQVSDRARRWGVRFRTGRLT